MSLGFFDRPAAYFTFWAPSGWGCDHTCQHPDGGGGGLRGHLTGADRKLSFRRQLFYKRIDTVLCGREQKSPEPGVGRCLQGSDKYRGSGRVWKLPCVAPGTAVRAEGVPRWQRSLFTRGCWMWELPLRLELLTNRPLSGGGGGGNKKGGVFQSSVWALPATNWVSGGCSPVRLQSVHPAQSGAWSTAAEGVQKTALGSLWKESQLPSPRV